MTGSGFDGGARYTSFDDYQESIENTPADRYFVDLVQRNPEVCTNCFLKIRDVHFPHDFALDKRGEHTKTWKSLVRYFIGKGERTESAAIDEDGAKNPPHACANCGSIRGSTVRPLPKDRAVDYAWNLSQTLAAFDVEHNPLTLAFVVAYRKQFPRFGSNDDDTFATAVEYAVDETSASIEDVFAYGPDNPAWQEGDPLTKRTALPAPDDDARPKAFHGRPALFETVDD
ncbi:MAG: hypothetical protein SV760_07700 [Halobacteria archaeon]|nr:hypothetical protein [Halobacteria archaeon]